MNTIQREITNLIEYDLSQDIGNGDITSNFLEKLGDKKSEVKIIFNEDGIFYGKEIIDYLMNKFNIQYSMLKKNGDMVNKQEPILSGYGHTTSILMIERTMLNVIQKLSGVSTMAKRFSDKVKHTNTRIYDTRKTSPGMRLLEKAAVKAGGCYNHRINLNEAILVKDNHISAYNNDIRQIVREVRSKTLMPIEIECDTIEQVLLCLEAKVDIIMLDNMNTQQILEAVKIIGKEAITEASGGVNLNNVAEIAETGVDRISVGAITHSSNNVDITLEIL